MGEHIISRWLKVRRYLFLLVLYAKNACLKEFFSAGILYKKRLIIENNCRKHCFTEQLPSEAYKLINDLKLVKALMIMK